MTSRKVRAQIAQQTLDILQQGAYALPDGSSVSLADSLQAAINGTKLYRPDDFPSLLRSLPVPAENATEFRVINCTTFAAAHAIIQEHPEVDPLCLNFASAKNPGGGFLGGSQAQEEALARASGLYACMNPVQDYYTINRGCGTCLYTDHMIYSPRVPVFRDDRDELLPVPFLTSILTAPAVNAGAVRNNEPQKLSQIEPVMRQRIAHLLTVAREQQHTHLVLGAWGCGVFKNSPVDLARWFHDQLTGNAHFRGAFQQVVFAVLDHSPDQSTFQAFADQFSD